jgi:hypothetical protein
MRECSVGAPRDTTRGRGVDGTKGAASRGGDSAVPKRWPERAVRAEPATEGEALGAAASR